MDPLTDQQRANAGTVKLYTFKEIAEDVIFFCYILLTLREPRNHANNSHQDLKTFTLSCTPGNYRSYYL